ncbi:MAG: hypothetical protein V3V08_07525 [Nannocystaceae bacterium]
MIDSGTPQAWASDVGSTYPIVELSTEIASSYWKNFKGYPSIVLLKPGMIVTKTQVGYSVTAAQIEEILP